MAICLWHAIVCCALILYAASVSGQERPKIFLGASSKTLGYSPLWVGSRKGFFDQQGLDVQLVLLRGVPMTVQALVGGSLHFGSGGPEPYIEAAERGLDMVVTGGIINGLTQFVIAAKNYKTYEDLRGATIGQSSLTGGIVTAFREAMKLRGLEYPRDYKLVVIAGGSSANLAAMQSGQIAATTVAVPLNYPAEEAGFNTLAFSGERSDRATLLGGTQSSGHGAVYARDGAVASMVARQPRRRRGIFIQGDAAQAGSRSQGLGILHAEPAMALRRRCDPGGNEKQYPLLRRPDRRQRATAGTGQICRPEFFTGSAERSRQKISRRLAPAVQGSKVQGFKGRIVRFQVEF